MKARRRRTPQPRPVSGGLAGHFTKEGRPKTPYRTEAEARSSAQASWAIYGVDLSAYRCDYCHQWHIGKRFSRD